MPAKATARSRSAVRGLRVHQPLSSRTCTVTPQKGRAAYAASRRAGRRAESIARFFPGRRLLAAPSPASGRSLDVLRPRGVSIRQARPPAGREGGGSEDGQDAHRADVRGMGPDAASNEYRKALASCSSPSASSLPPPRPARQEGSRGRGPDGGAAAIDRRERRRAKAKRSAEPGAEPPEKERFAWKARKNSASG
jgi:hypothetical protein